jgi:hypothetical protein
MTCQVRSADRTAPKLWGTIVRGRETVRSASLIVAPLALLLGLVVGG